MATFAMQNVFTSLQLCKFLKSQLKRSLCLASLGCKVCNVSSYIYFPLCTHSWQLTFLKTLLVVFVAYCWMYVWKSVTFMVSKSYPVQTDHRENIKASYNSPYCRGIHPNRQVLWTGFPFHNSILYHYSISTIKWNNPDPWALLIQLD